MVDEDVDSTARSSGRGARPQRLISLLGPAFVAAVAYVDPGNVATNVSAGSSYGYLLVWVLVASSAIAVLVQYLSAKLGLVTGQSLPTLIGDRLRSRTARLLFWFQAQLVAIATDLAEVIGGALALQLLFGLPLWAGGIIIGAVSMLLLTIPSRWGSRAFERTVGGILMVIVIGFCAGLFFAHVRPGEVAAGLVPRFAGPPTVLLASSMLGATVMPHAIYLHSSLSLRVRRDAADPARSLRAARLDVVGALLVAGSVNVAMLVLAAAVLRGVPGTDTIQGAQLAIAAKMGPGVATVFAVGLLASGLASSSVGAQAGSVITASLLHRRMPAWLRRTITLVPALVVLAFGVEPTAALVWSQALLSLGLPFATIPLAVMVGSREVMGDYVNSRWLQALTWLIVGLVVVLNISLVVITIMAVTTGL